MLNCLFRYACVCFLLLRNLSVAGQPILRDTQFYPPSHFKILHYGVEEGLSQGTNYSMLKDSRGFLWLTSYEGLNRYDGHQFKVYRSIPEDSCSFKGGASIGLVEDPYGNIWTGSPVGLNCWKFVEDCFHFIPATDPEGRAINTRTYPFFADSTYVWYTNGTEGILRYDLQQKKKEVVSSRWKYGQTDYRIHSVTYQPDGYIYIRLQRGLVRFNPETGKTELFFSPDPENVQGEPQEFHCLKYANDSTIYLGIRRGIVIFNPKEKTFRTIGLSSILQTSNIGDIQILADGKLWLGSSQEGSLIFDPNTGGIQRITAEHGLANDANSSLLFDRDGLMWINTDPAGINLLLENLTPFQKYNRDFLQRYGIRSPVVRAFYETEEGKIWVGMEFDGAFLFDPRHNRIERILNSESLPASFPRQGRCFFVDANGILWIGSPEGLYRFHLEQNRPLPPMLWDDTDANFYWDFQELPDGTLFMGTDGGVYYLRPGSSQPKAFSPLGKIRTGSLYLDEEGYLYVPEDNRGFYRFRPEEWLEHLENDAPKPALSHFLPGINVKCFYYDKASALLWLATNGGLLKTRPLRGWQEVAIEKNYSVADGLPSEYLYAVIPDGQGKLWLSSNRGIAQFDPEKEQFLVYGQENGIQGYEFNTNAFLQTRSGEIYFGGVNGFNRFFPHQIRQNPNPAPAPLLTGLEVNGLPFREKGYVGAIEFLSLKYWQNTLEIEFVSPDYFSLGNNQYRYRLMGFDDDWIDAGQRNFARYTKLPSGAYQFEAVAANSAGRWGSSSRVLHISIAPPWWRAGWAYGFYAILLAGALYGVYRFQKRRWELNIQLQLEKREGQRLKELDAFKSRFYTNISHDFRTPLTSITGLAGRLLQSDGIPLPEGVQRIQQNSNILLHLVDQLLDISKLENGKLSLRPVQTDIVRLVKRWVDEHQLLAADRSVTLSMQAEPSQIMADVDARLLHHIISNLLSNALKFTPRGGTVALSVVRSKLPDGGPTTTGSQQQNTVPKYQLALTVRDTGPGISPEQLNYIFDRFYGIGRLRGSGLGLSFVKELAELMGATLNVESPAPGTEGGGSIFRLVLPVSNQAPLTDNPLPLDGKGHSAILPLPPSTPLSPASARLLIVEDNPDMARYLGNLLGSYYHIIVARNSKEALRLATSQPISLVVSDVMMEQEDEGFTLCRELKNTEATAHLPVILLTARADQPGRLEGLEQGADAYLAKPFDERELLTRASQLIQLRQVLLQKYQKLALQALVGQFRLAPADQELLERVNAGCLEHLADRSFGPAEMAALVGKSSTAFNEWLQEQIGYTPAEYLRRLRLNMAHELIIGTKETIESIAARTGFTDGAYLAKKYKVEFGITPREARKSLKEQ
ncbi:MAG: response regulator [Lewinellaceae bacterium]|nr:response regulator [Lewinellaceae bacterium]